MSVLSVGFVWELVISSDSVVGDGEEVTLESVTMSVTSVGFKVLMLEVVICHLFLEKLSPQSLSPCL